MTVAEASETPSRSVLNVALILFVWSCLTHVVRIWVKRRAWSPDDTVISVALGFILLHLILTLKAAEYGYGHTWSSLNTDDREQSSKLLYAAQIFYILALGSVRISSAIFNTRLTLERGSKTVAKCVTFSCGIWIFISILVIAFRGHLSEPWLIEDGSYPMYLRWLGIDIVGTTLDLTLWILSIYFICRLNMSLSKKIYLSTIFACRLIIIPFTILRLIYLSPSHNTDMDSPPLTAAIYTEMALNLALISSSVTCLKPFLRPFHTDYSTNPSRTTGHLGGLKNSRGDTYYILSATRSANDNHHPTALTSLSERGAIESINVPAPSFRPDDVRTRVTVECNACRDNIKKSDDQNRMTISMTTEWDVTYEDGCRTVGAQPRDCNH